ncbi:hypothetical protein HaLaN_22727, partial [Haematococcus lacustris]
MAQWRMWGSWLKLAATMLEGGCHVLAISVMCLKTRVWSGTVCTVRRLWLDGDLMHHPARPLRLGNVAEALKCRGIRNASAPHRVQPVPHQRSDGFAGSALASAAWEALQQ